MPTAKVFASLRQVVGAGEFTLEAATLGAFLKKAEEVFGPEFSRQLPHCTVLVNGAGVSVDADADMPVSDADQIAILPPVGGGGRAASGPRRPGRWSSSDSPALGPGHRWQEGHA